MESTNRSSELISLVKEALADLKAQRCGSARESKRYMEDAATLAVGRIEDALLMKLFEESHVLNAAFELRQAVRQVSLRMERLLESEDEKGGEGCLCFTPSRQADVGGAWKEVFLEGKSAFDQILNKQQVTHALSNGRIKQSISLIQLQNKEEASREPEKSTPARSSLRLQASTFPSSSHVHPVTLDERPSDHPENRASPPSPTSPKSRTAALMAAAVAAAFVGPDAAALPPFPLLEPAYSISSSLGGLSSAGGSIRLGAHGAIISQLASNGHWPHPPSPSRSPSPQPHNLTATNNSSNAATESHSSVKNANASSLQALQESDSVDPGMITLKRSVTSGIPLVSILAEHEKSNDGKETPQPQPTPQMDTEASSASLVPRTISHTKNKSVDLASSPSEQAPRNFFPSLSLGGSPSAHKRPSLSSKSRNSSLMDLVSFNNSSQQKQSVEAEASSSHAGHINTGGLRFKTGQIRKSSRKGPVDLILFISPPSDEAEHSKSLLPKTDSLVSTQASTVSAAGSKSQGGHPPPPPSYEQQLLVVSGNSTFVYSSRLAGAHSDIVTSSPVTSAATHEGSGALWTGHLDGAIRLCLPRASEAPTPLLPHPNLPSSASSSTLRAHGKKHVESEIQPDPLPSTSAPEVPPPASRWSITAMHVSEEGVLWAGDASGRVLAASYNPALHSVVLTWPPKLLASPFSSSPSSTSQPSSSPQPQAQALAQPVVTSLICKHGIVAAATSLGNLCLIRCSDAIQLGATSFGKAFGTCETMATLRWRPDQPRPPKNCEALGWRLVTGHQCGQCLVWDLSNGRAAAVCSLGSRGSPVKGIGVCYGPLDLIVLGFEDGRLAVGPLPSASMSNFSSSSAGGASKIPNWVLVHDVVIAHHSKITALACSGTTIATGSSIGGVKTWDLMDLKLRAETKGIFFPLSQKDSAGLYAAVERSKRESGESMHLPSPSSHGNMTKLPDSFPGFVKSSTPVKPPPLSVNPQALSSAEATSPTEVPSLVVLSPTGDQRKSNSSKLPSPLSSRPMSRSPSSNIISDWISMHGAGGTGGMHGPAGLYSNLIKREELRIIEEIGRGAEGSVYRGRWHHIDVAVKEMHPQSSSFSRLVSMAEDIRHTGQSMVFDAIVHELQALIDVSQHPNIIRFIGLCMDPPRIVTEYYPLGSLFSIITRAREGDAQVTQQLSWARRLQMLHNIAAGMAYLHSRSYVHGDLRSPNIFVGLDGHVKIGDFGFARLLGEGESSSNTIGRTTNPRWLAPEVLRDGRTSRASDVFSFAIIMWEMLTWQIPYTGYLSLQVTFHHTTDDFRPDIPDDSDLPWLSRVGPHSKVNLDPFKSLMVECWHQDPEQRPSFSEVAARLSALMHWQSTVGRIRAQLAAAATNAASASSSGVINQGKGSLPSISSQVHSSSSSMLSSAVNQPVPPPRSSHKDNSETSTVQIASHQGELNPDPYASLEASESKAELTGPFGNAFASAIAATEFGLRDGSAAGDSEGGLSANFSLSSSVISGPFGGAFGNASLALTSAIDSTNAGGPLSWVSYPPTNAHGAHSSIPLLLPSKESGGSHLPINNGPEMQLPAMPMPGEPTTLLTPEAAAWLNSIMASKKLQQQQKKQALAPSWPKTPTRVAAAAAGAATDGGSSQPCPPSQTKALLQRPSVGEEAPDPLSFFQPPPQLKTIASSTRKGSVDEGQSSVIPGSPIIVPVDGF